jgi:tetratricopeptide (TPR) repeat protein
MNFKKLIEQGEIAREHEDYSEALRCFDLAIVEAGSVKDWLSVTQALGHKLIIYKHLFQKTRERPFLELMLKDAEAYLNIANKKKLPSEIKKIPLLRIADYDFLTGAYTKAVTVYQSALAHIPKRKVNEIAEYQSHYALALIKANRPELGLDLLRDSLSKIEKAKGMRPSHRLVVKSGIFGRIALASIWMKDGITARQAFEKAMIDALILEKKYKRPMRLRQLEILRNEIER